MANTALYILMQGAIVPGCPLVAEGRLDQTFFFKQIECFSYNYSKTCLKRPFKKKAKIGFQDQLSLNAGQKYCRMLQREHSAIFLTFIKLPFVIKIFVLSIFEWLLKTGFTV